MALSHIYLHFGQFDASIILLVARIFLTEELSGILYLLGYADLAVKKKLGLAKLYSCCSCMFHLHYYNVSEFKE